MIALDVINSTLPIQILLKEKREKKKASSSGGVAGCKEATMALWAWFVFMAEFLCSHW
jgi:hypothetical protein